MTLCKEFNSESTCLKGAPVEFKESQESCKCLCGSLVGLLWALWVSTPALVATTGCTEEHSRSSNMIQKVVKNIVFSWFFEEDCSKTNGFQWLLLKMFEKPVVFLYFLGPSGPAPRLVGLLWVCCSLWPCGFFVGVLVGLESLWVLVGSLGFLWVSTAG